MYNEYSNFQMMVMSIHGVKLDHILVIPFPLVKQNKCLQERWMVCQGKELSKCLVEDGIH